MPVTARLSRRFYEKFGDEIVNELVEWFNQVDLAYRSEVRELNESNFARLRELNEANFVRLREINDVNSQRFDAKLERRLAELKAELIKWMFLFWAGTALAGLLLR
jgi:predicted acetyltransferase